MMSGPLMHQAAMERCRDLIVPLGLNVEVGSKVDVMGPDFSGSHGYDMDTNGGSILDKAEGQYEVIRGLIQASGGSYASIDRNALSKAVQWLCHYTEDAHTIGQISSKFWGSVDNRIDAATELCWGKKDYPVSLNTYPDKATVRSALLSSMRVVYDCYKGSAAKWWFPMSGSCRDMARNAVKCGAEFAAAYVKLALS